MALIPPTYLNAVVSLGTVVESFEHVGTGSLYAHPLPSTQGRTPYRAYVVTNRHVAGDVTHVRFNHPDTGLTVDRSAPSPRTPGPFTRVTQTWPSRRWRNPVLSEGRKLLDAEMSIGDIGTSFGDGVQPVEGDGIFVIGFPLGLVGDARNYPVVRYGVIARIQDWVRRDEERFLID